MIRPAAAAATFRGVSPGPGLVARVRLLLAGAAAVLLAGCGSDPPGLSLLPTDAVVLAFGNSLTYGTGVSPGQSYPAQLETLIDREVVREGVPGEITRRGLARLPRVLEEVQPDLVVLCHAGNDILRKLDLGAARTNLEEMIRLSREAGAEVVLIGVPARGISLSTADLYHEVAEAAGVPLESDVVGDILGDNRLKSDAVHPNAAGYRKMAEAVAELLRDAGAI